jgi:hypothetical protein
MKYPTQAVRQEKGGKFILTFPFVLFRPSMGWMMAIHTREGNLLH